MSIASKHSGLDAPTAKTLSSSHGGILPPPALLAAVRQKIGELGLHPAAKALGLSRAGLAAFASGGRVRKGTVLVIARAMRWPGDALEAAANDGDV